MRQLASIELDASMAATPVAANGVLYVTTLRTLYAVAERARGPTADAAGQAAGGS